MPLRVYNTLTGQKEEFVPVVPGSVGIYCCGPTVYMNSHIGHMVGPVIFDTVKRYLTFLGFKVTLVINITDVEDKLINQAAVEGTSVAALAERVTADYRSNLQKLGVDGIDLMPRATENIPEIIRITRGLIDKGYAYVASGDVYFDVTKDEDYGKLSHRDPEALQAGARVEPSPLKRNPGDFALWKAAKAGEPAWESPWGNGRPGWHIECTAMAMRYLGPTFDIHGGGLDLVFPHHENEIAQSESYSGKTFARYWMHNGLLQRTGDSRKLGSRRIGDLKDQETEKMSKSKGNIVPITELLTRHRPETIRFFLLATHYRRPIDFSDARIEEVSRGMHAFYRFFERYERMRAESYWDVAPFDSTRGDTPGDGHPELLGEVSAQRTRFLEAMDDDFNTGGAIGVLYDLLRSLNGIADRMEFETKEATDRPLQAALQHGVSILRELSGILGVFRAPTADRSKRSDGLTDKLMQLFIELRKQARTQKNFALADDIRKRLSDLGVTLEDRPEGTTWRID
jgi:cysteinyl-tRNA synthetase